MTDTTVEQIEQEYQNGLAALFTEYEGKTVKLYGEERHAAKIAALAATKAARLEDVLSRAESDKKAADQDAGLIHIDNTTWLNEAELQAAGSRAKFVNDDMAGLSVDGQLALARQAMQSGDRAGAWLIWRAMPATTKAAAAENAKLGAAVGRMLADLESYLMPADLAHKRQTAAARQLEAEERRIAAKYALHKARGSSQPFNPW